MDRDPKDTPGAHRGSAGIRSRFKDAYLAEHGDNANTRGVLRFFDKNCARVQATCDIGPFEPKVRVEGSFRGFEDSLGLHEPERDGDAGKEA